MDLILIIVQQDKEHAVNTQLSASGAFCNLHQFLVSTTFQYFIKIKFHYNETTITFVSLTQKTKWRTNLKSFY